MKDKTNTTKNNQDINEWHVNEIKKAVEVADNRETKWIAHKEIIKEFLPNKGF